MPQTRMILESEWQNINLELAEKRMQLENQRITLEGVYKIVGELQKAKDLAESRVSLLQRRLQDRGVEQSKLERTVSIRSIARQQNQTETEVTEDIAVVEDSTEEEEEDVIDLTMQEALQQERRRNHMLEDQIKSLLMDVEHNRRQSSISAELASSSVEEKERQIRRVEFLNRELSTARSAVHDHRLELVNKGEDSADMEERYSMLQRQLEDVTGVVGDYEETARVKSEENEQLLFEHGQVTQHNRVLSERNALLEAEHTILVKKLEKKVSIVASMTTELCDTKERLSTVQQSSMQCCAELSDTKRELTLIRERVAKLMSECSSLRQSVEESEQEHSRVVERMVEESKGVVEELEGKIKTSDSAYSELQSRCEKAEKRVRELNTSSGSIKRYCIKHVMEKRVNEQDNIIRHQNEELNSLKKRISTADSRVSGIERTFTMIVKVVNNAARSMKAVNVDLLCSKCGTFLTNPCTFVPCGHSYCYSCSETIKGMSRGRPTCALCGPKHKVLSHLELLSVHVSQLKKTIAGMG